MKIRLGQIWAPTGPGDEKSSEEILNALQSLTQADLQDLLLSRLREVIFGDDVTKHWYSEFRSAGIPSLSEISASSEHTSDGTCLPEDNVGDVVCITGEALDGRIQVSRVDIADPVKVPGIGVITTKTDDTACTVARYGLVSAQLTAPKGLCFVGANGRPTLTRPSPLSGGSCFVQVIGAAWGSNQVLLNPSFNLTLVKS
jgi:hypothetical protein